MLKALLLPDQKTTLAPDAIRGLDYECPECHSKVVYKNGIIVCPHFAHKPGSDCTLSTGESLRHVEMKYQVGLLLNRLGFKIDFEVWFTKTHRADLIATKRELKVVVECQASAIAIPEFEERNKFYNSNGYLMFWVWDFARFNKISAEIVSEYRVPAEISLCQRSNYGKVYTLKPYGALLSCHINYRTKTMGSMTLKNANWLPQPKTNASGTRVLDLNEGVYWETKKQKLARWR